MTNNAASNEFEITESKSYVKIKYKVQIAGGAVLKGADQPEIMDFVTGYLQVVPGLEKRLIGHKTGETLSFTVPVEEAFGERRKELVLEKSKEDFYFPGDFYPYPGMELPLVIKGGEGPDTAVIREVKEQTIVLDLNHPLSGTALKYDLEIVEARPAKDSDVCSEWDNPSEGEASCPAIQEVVLGREDD